MRISDWSSDVCSSEAHRGQREVQAAGKKGQIVMTRKGLIGCDRAIMVTAVEVGVLLTFLRVLVRRMDRLDMVRKLRIRRLVRHARQARKSVVEGKSVSVSVNLGGRRTIKT